MTLPWTRGRPAAEGFGPSHDLQIQNVNIVEKIYPVPTSEQHQVHTVYKRARVAVTSLNISTARMGSHSLQALGTK